MKFIKAAIITIIFLTAFSVNTKAQDDTIRIETNLVTVNVAVTDKSGNYVKGLKKEDFELWDNKTKLTIENFSAEFSPVSLGIVYDLHPTTDERTANVLTALKQFTGDLNPKDNFFVTVFNERGSLTTDFVPTSEQINANLTELKPTTPNSLYDGIFAASEKVRARKNTKQVLFVLTDGKDNSSHHSLKELRTHLRSINLPVYSIAFSNDDSRLFSYNDIFRNQGRQTLGVFESKQLDTAALAEISKSSGGQNIESSVQNRFQLYGICKKVLSEVENQYVIGFYPEALDGKWHKLKVRVIDSIGKNYKLSSRKGYLGQKSTK